MSPLLNSAVKAISRGTKLKANPWRIKSSNFYFEAEKARSLFAKIFNVKSDTIAIIPSASYGIETAAKNLSYSLKKDIVILDKQFPSNVYPWIRLAKEKNVNIRTIPINNNDLTSSILNNIDETCGIISLPNVLWTTGQAIDLIKVRKKCDNINAALVVDLTQSAGAMSTNFSIIKPDFAVVANYKWMLGPYTTGFLYADPKYHQGQPLEESWITRRKSSNFANLINYTEKFQEGAIRFDMGERANFSLIPGVIAALEQLLDWEISKIEYSLKIQNDYLAIKLKDMGLRVLNVEQRGPHFLSAELPTGLNPNLLQILESKGIYVSIRSNFLRITPHLWNNLEELDFFAYELSSAI